MLLMSTHVFRHFQNIIRLIFFYVTGSLINENVRLINTSEESSFFQEKSLIVRMNGWTGGREQKVSF